MTGADVRAVREYDGDLRGKPLHLETGMRVTTRRNENLGEITSILVEQDTQETQFIVIQREHEGRRVLLPAMAIETTRENALVTRIRQEDADQLPTYDETRNPTREEIQQAHHTIGSET